MSDLLGSAIIARTAPYQGPTDDVYGTWRKLSDDLEWMGDSMVALRTCGHATPMTYLGPRSGKQFVAIAAGGGGYLSPTYADALVAFALK